jgi:putative phosphoribosyl transferase
MTHRALSRSSSIRVDGDELHRHIVAPRHAHGIVVFAHRGGHSVGDAPIVHALEARGVATVRVDLIRDGDDREESAVRATAVLAVRIAETIDWLRADADLCDLPLGLFGSGPSTAAALLAAARRPASVAAVVCCNGRPDLAGDELAGVHAPTLFVVGRNDEVSVTLDRDVASRFQRPPTLSLLDGVRRVLEDPDAVAEAARLAGDWFIAQFEVAREAMSRRGLGDPAC